ncbi:MAG: hypothetical protein MJA83_17750, partial [Gammaproteobacteria bacterium]|nr:hypothetical protein [Gammaproteobacteria bacterium]
AASIEKEDGDILKLDITKSIDENLAGAKRKPYLYCTDEDTLGVDPLCTRWDRGVTPKEIALNKIREYNFTVLKHY